MNLMDELNLRRRLFNLPRDSVEYIKVGSGDDETLYRIDRVEGHFRVSTCTGDPVGVFPPRGTVATDFFRYRAVSGVLSAIYGAEIAPELIYPNIVRVGARYAAYHFEGSRKRLVLYAATAYDAHEEYEAWKSIRDDQLYNTNWVRQGRYTRREGIAA